MNRQPHTYIPMYNEQFALIDQWHKTGIELSKKRARQSTLLLTAASVGHVEAAAKLIVTPGIRVLLQHPESALTALHLAAMNGHTNIVSMLLAHPQTRVNHTCIKSNSVTALMVAAKEGHDDVAQVLIDAKADVDLECFYGYTATFRVGTL